MFASPPSPPAILFSVQAVAFAVAAALPKLVGCGIGLALTLHSPRSATRQGLMFRVQQRHTPFPPVSGCVFFLQRLVHVCVHVHELLTC